MIPQAISHLNDIASIAASFITLLDKHIPKSHRLPVLAKPSQLPPLHLPDVDSQSLHQALSRLPMSKSLTSAVTNLFDSRKSELFGCFTTNWRGLCSFPRRLGSESIQLLELAFQEKYRDAIKALEQKILALLDEKLDKFHLDAEASAQSEMESSSEDGIGLARGHSRLAVKILEKAYERTTNISRAEKLRLAAATKLEPRQVTIWFQNRRNRKVAAAAAQPGVVISSPTVAPTTPKNGSKKRKAEGLYDGEVRQPSQRLRTATPDNPNVRHVLLTSTSSTSSMNSSIDSLASFSRGIAGKSRNYSTDSSEMETADTCYSSKGYLEGSTSFDDQVVLQSGRVPSVRVKEEEEEDPYNALIFSDAGQAQLDFEDLGLDLESMAEDLPNFDMSDFSFAMPQPSALISNQSASSHSVNSTPRRSAFIVPSVPTTPFDHAAALNVYNVDAAEELRRAQLIEEWAFGMSPLIEESEEDELYLNLDGLGSRGKSSPSSDYMSTSGSSSSNVATPQDIFDFSLNGLCLDHIMSERLESYQGKEIGEILPSRPRDLSIDVDAANAYPQEDSMPTVRDTRQECLAR